MSLRTRLRDFTLNRMKARVRDYPADHLSRSAIVFSPHFDDETLGCGGLVIKKKCAGADVKIVFMTDGSRSHPHLMPPEQLKAIRASEGVAAARALGLSDDDVFRLGFDETQLDKRIDEAASRITAILEQVRPQEIYLPYSGEPLLWSADHQSTTRIVYQALRQYGHEVAVYEYPIWCWYSLPWIDPRRDGWRSRLIILRNSVSTWLGLRFIRDFQWSVDISDVVGKKRRALEQHRSQMTPLIEGVGWATLDSVSNGQFLACFFTEREIFRAVRRD